MNVVFGVAMVVDTVRCRVGRMRCGSSEGRQTRSYGSDYLTLLLLLGHSLLRRRLLCRDVVARALMSDSGGLSGYRQSLQPTYDTAVYRVRKVDIVD
jgi:hypothetical protein